MSVSAYSIFWRLLKDFIAWTNANQGFVQVLLTSALVGATTVLALVAARANGISREQMKQALEREQSRTRPYLSFDLHVTGPNEVFCILTNHGQTAAYDISVRSEPDIKGVASTRDGQLATLTRSVPYLPPGTQVVEFVAPPRWFEDNHDKHIFEIALTYSDSGHERYEEHMSIDFDLKKRVASSLPVQLGFQWNPAVFVPAPAPPGPRGVEPFGMDKYTKG